LTLLDPFEAALLPLWDAIGHLSAYAYIFVNVGFGILLIWLINQFGLGVYILAFLQESYRAIKGLCAYITTHFHYDKPNEIFALSIVWFVMFLVIIYSIGGAGIAGAPSGSGEGLLQLNSEGVNIGTNDVILGTSDGLNDAYRPLATTSLLNGANATTTTIPTTLSCTSNPQCGVLFPTSRGNSAYPFCCPINSGPCGGFCNVDCSPTCESICIKFGYDTPSGQYGCEAYGCEAGTVDYSSCLAQCIATSCVSSFNTVFLVSPTNSSSITDSNINFDWVIA